MVSKKSGRKYEWYLARAGDKLARYLFWQSPYRILRRDLLSRAGVGGVVDWYHGEYAPRGEAFDATQPGKLNRSGDGGMVSVWTKTEAPVNHQRKVLVLGLSHWDFSQYEQVKHLVNDNFYLAFLVQDSRRVYLGEIGDLLPYSHISTHERTYDFARGPMIFFELSAFREFPTNAGDWSIFDNELAEWVYDMTLIPGTISRFKEQLDTFFDSVPGNRICRVFEPGQRRPVLEYATCLDNDKLREFQASILGRQPRQLGLVSPDTH